MHFKFLCKTYLILEGKELPFYMYTLDYGRVKRKILSEDYMLRKCL